MTDIHTEHCCILHGCKYSDENCTVTTRKERQSHACEACDFYQITWRPWGRFQILYNGLDCKVKQIVIEPGQRISLQRHRYRSEDWTCVGGQGMVLHGEDPANLMDDLLQVGDHIQIPPGTIHRATAGPNGFTFIEVQTGSSFSESDIERFEDDYGRIK